MNKRELINIIVLEFVILAFFILSLYQSYELETNQNRINELEQTVEEQYYLIDSLKQEEQMKHIVSFSGGKDSTAMLLRMLEENMHVDEILFCDTGKDFPDMVEHIEQVKKYIKEKYNKNIIILKSEKR